MAKPILFDKFNGLWIRGPVDKTPSDHFSDCLNTIYADAEVGMRDGLSAYLSINNVIQMALYKPNPPFTGTNVPRIIALNSSGELFDILLSPTVPIYTNALMTSFGFVNFFGRAYISPANGKTGLENEYVKVYNGTEFRDAAGPVPTTALTASMSASAGNCDAGTYLLSYAFETSTGFITRPATPFAYVDCFGSGVISVDTLPTGPLGTAARWIIMTKAIPFRADLGSPPNVEEAEVLPLYFALRVGNNIDTTAEISLFDEQLIEDAAYLFTQFTQIPAGVGLIDYKGRMVSYGEFSNPSLVRVSAIGEPEAFSETSGFLITDPSDNTGVRSCIEFRNTLYAYKQSRGYITEDNGLEASTWQVINFEKSIGTEQSGIADILDAKGASSEGFIIASLGAIYFFNGVVQEPELSYKIRDLWLRVNEPYFHLVQAVNDPVNKRLYFLVPLDSATAISHIIYGDYRNGMGASTIKWSLWQFAEAPTSLLAYTDFTNDIANLVTRISGATKIRTLNVNVPSNDDGSAVSSYFKLAPVRYGYGVSQFNKIRARVQGPCTMAIVAYGQDDTISYTPASISVPSATPGREYAQLMNLVSEQCQLKFTVDTLDEKYKVNTILIEGTEYADERPR